MVDLSWLSDQAHTIHDTFIGIFYCLATVLLMLGVIIEYFKLPLGGSGAIPILVGRVLIATILLNGYPEISNAVADIADAITKQLGDMNQFKTVLSAYGDQLHHMSFSWTSVKDSIIMIFSFLLFFLLYISVYLSDAGIIFGWTILYVFSPILIAMYILPATASATTSLFRSLFEICAWKIVWTVLATLLWSYGLSSVNKPQGDVNFLTVLALNFILAASLLLTPKVVHALVGGGIANFAADAAGVGAAAGMFNPGQKFAKLMSKANEKFGTGAAGRLISKTGTNLKQKFFPEKNKNTKVGNSSDKKRSPRSPSKTVRARPEIKRSHNETTTIADQSPPTPDPELK